MPCVLRARADSAAAQCMQGYPVLSASPQDGIWLRWWHIEALLAVWPGWVEQGAGLLPHPQLCVKPWVIMPYKVRRNPCGLMSPTLPCNREMLQRIPPRMQPGGSLPPPGHSPAPPAPVGLMGLGWIPRGWGCVWGAFPGTAGRGRAEGRDLLGRRRELDLAQARRAHRLQDTVAWGSFS